MSPFAGSDAKPAVQGPKGGSLICSQKARSRATRSSGALPAMIAALMAPIEMPATQSGR